MPPARVSDTLASTAEGQWWIVANGEPQGPYSEAYVRLTLEQAEATDDILLCPVGGSAWRPAGEWPSFMRVTGSHRRPRGNSQNRGTRQGASAAVVLIRTLGLYAVFVAPVLFGIELVATVTGDALTDDLNGDSPLVLTAVGLECFWITLSLGTTVYLGLAGWRLLGNSAAGVTPIMYALWARMFCAVAEIPILLLWFGLVSLQADAPDERPIGTWHSLGHLLFFGAFVFELVILVWLHLNRHWLIRVNAIQQGQS